MYKRRPSSLRDTTSSTPLPTSNSIPSYGHEIAFPCFVLVLLMTMSLHVSAQINFDPAIVNPYGLTNIGDINTPTFVDLDNDGDYDIISGETLGRFYYFENTGSASSPSFATGVLNSFGLADAGAKSDITFVDIDDDGDLDGISGSSNGIFKFHENTGTVSDPAFAIGVNSPFSLTDVGIYSTVTLADLDNDGDYDLLSGEQLGNIIYFENIGTASLPNFDTAETNPFSLYDFQDRTYPTLIDFDGDSDYDLMVGEENGTFNFLENQGTLTAPNFVGVSIVNPFSLVDLGTLSNGSFADLDDDGDLDFISGEDQGDFYYHENTTTAPTFSTEFNYELVVENPFSLTNGSGYTTTTFGDLDNDGDLDLMTGTQNGFLQYYENEGSASASSFAARIQNPFSLTDVGDYSTACFVDLDDDDDLDLMVGEEEGSFNYFENIGTVSSPIYTSVVSNPYSLTDIGDYSTVSFVDIDNDEDFDMMAGAQDGNFYYFENTGTKSSPGFTTVVLNPYSLTDIGAHSTIDFSDMDNDGDLDMVAGGRSGYFYYFENTGTVSVPSFGTVIVNNFSTSDIGDYSTVGFADLDNDGDEDLFSGELLSAYHYFERKTQSTSITWVGGTSTSWNNSTNWDGNIIPTTTDNVTIPDVTNDPDADGDIEVNSLTLESGANLTIGTNNSILVNYEFVLNGALDLASGASLTPLGDVSGTGSATIDRNTTFGVSDGKYSIIGSPVLNDDTDALGSIVYGYDETVAYDAGVTDGANRFIAIAAPETMEAGEAYFSANTGDISFSGIPRSGEINLTLVYDETNDGGSTHAGFNLVSNPYTAAISYDDFVAENDDIDGTIYLWDDGGSNVGNRSNSDYITANSIGSASGGSSRSGSWDGYIRSAQGFFVKATTDGTLHFEPSMMSTGNNSDAGYFRQTNPTVLRFALTSDNEYQDMLIAFSEKATKAIDRSMDAQKIRGNSEIQLYSKLNDVELAIQTLPILTEEQTINVGMNIDKPGTYTFELKEASTASFSIYLRDNELNKVINLKENQRYSFVSSAAIQSSRFSLVFSPDRLSLLALEEDKASNNEIIVYSNDSGLNIRMNKALSEATISIYNLHGSLIHQVSSVDFNQLDWNMPFDRKGLYVLTVQTKHEQFVRKFIF